VRRRNPHGVGVPSPLPWLAGYTPQHGGCLVAGGWLLTAARTTTKAQARQGGSAHGQVAGLTPHRVTFLSPLHKVVRPHG
jgi:hypothetical protein